MTNNERKEFLALKEKIKKLTIANRGLNQKIEELRRKWEEK
tara:strand:- start:853 stop:975 length:123 start_codon:yes stop_codon:yes gene_type:complete